MVPPDNWLVRSHKTVRWVKTTGRKGHERCPAVEKNARNDHNGVHLVFLEKSMVLHQFLELLLATLAVESCGSGLSCVVNRVNRGYTSLYGTL